MSERLNPAVIVFTGVILCGLCWIGGKHSADRWWQAQVAQQANQATTCYPVEDGRTTNWCTTGAPAGIGKPQAQPGNQELDERLDASDGWKPVSSGGAFQPTSSSWIESKPVQQVEWHEDCKINEQCPPSTAKEVEPTWNEHAHWQQYSLPPYWTCPAGYEQVIGNQRFSASKPGEMASGSEDHAHKPKCELPDGTFGVPTPQVPQ